MSDIAFSPLDNTFSALHTSFPRCITYFRVYLWKYWPLAFNLMWYAWLFLFHNYSIKYNDKNNFHIVNVWYECRKVKNTNCIVLLHFIIEIPIWEPSSIICYPKKCEMGMGIVINGHSDECEFVGFLSNIKTCFLQHWILCS